MTNVTEPRGVAVDDTADDQPANESELASLVRRWMQAGSRGRQANILRLAPAPEPGPELVEVVDEAVDEDVLETAEEPIDELVDEQAGEQVDEPVLRVPALPLRPTAHETEHATRLAVLIDARRVSEDVAAGLLAHLGVRGTVNVCRAYADWSRSELGSWIGRLRREGLHSFHQFADDDDQALVAMAIDAVDIAREASVDQVVIAGDMTSMLPLVHRLHAAGVRVVVVGPGRTPHDVRAACDEFIDGESLVGETIVPVGRHRA